MSKICISCGAALDDNALFCDDCGAKQDVQFTVVTGSSQQEMEQPVAAESNAEPLIKQDDLYDPAPVMEEEPLLKQSKTGIAALVMGILAIVTLGSFIIFDILGIVFGVIGLRKKDRKTGFAKAGLILSLAATVIIVVVVTGAVLFGW